MPEPDTLLVMSVIGLPPGSARGVQQVFKMIDQAAVLRRTANGRLKNTAPPMFKKYSIDTSCDDVNLPVLAGIYIGAELQMDTASEVPYLTSGGTPHRTVVPGSEVVEGDHTYFRMRLQVMVTDFQWTYDELGGTNGWRMTVEEI